MDYNSLIILYITFACAGVFSGFLAGLLGVGGGLVLVPIFYILFEQIHIPKSTIPILSLGSSMACICGTSISSSLSHYKLKNIHSQTLIKAIIPLILGTFLGSKIAHFFSPFALQLCFIVFALYMGKQMIFTQTSLDSQSSHPHVLKQKFLNQHTFIFSFIGIISSWIGIGGGSLNVPYLNQLGIDFKKAVGTSAVLGFPIALGGAIGYATTPIELSPHFWHTGAILWSAVTPTLFVSLLFAPIGAYFQQKLPQKTLKKIFGALLWVFAFKTLSSSLSFLFLP